jgi:non-ribosomal peptide synthetase component E (peptide arylation enzyme)
MDAQIARTTSRTILTTTRTARRKANKEALLLLQVAGTRLQKMADFRPRTVLACQLQESTKAAESTVEVVKDRQ